MNNHLVGSGVWVSRLGAIRAASEQLKSLRDDAVTETEKRIGDAYRAWRHSGIIHFFTRRPRPDYTGIFETGMTPAINWFHSLPYFSWGGLDQISLEYGIGSRGDRLKELLAALERVPLCQQRVFLSLEDLNTIGTAVDYP